MKKLRASKKGLISTPKAKQTYYWHKMVETMDNKSVPVPIFAAGKITYKVYLTWRTQLVSLAQIKGWGLRSISITPS